jgi:hypothetical protein
LACGNDGQGGIRYADPFTFAVVAPGPLLAGAPPPLLPVQPARTSAGPAVRTREPSGHGVAATSAGDFTSLAAFAGSISPSP